MTDEERTFLQVFMMKRKGKQPITTGEAAKALDILIEYVLGEYFSKLGDN